MGPRGRIKMTQSPDGVCTISVSTTTKDDSGSYTCEVSNESGASKSDAVGTVAGT